ncbi:MAG: MiaB/RimO family radical SAM methylthiotransferase, partial [Planctomycetota bacterium]
IPMMRGKHVTKPIEKIVAEARELAADGVKELILVAQDTTYYGLDLYGEVRLVELLHELERVDGIEWVRLMYLYPIHFTDRLIDTIAASEKIIPYLDMPLQHINSRVLKRMSRRVDRDAIVMLTDKLRSQIPNLVMRTTFVVGFPGETDAQFDELCDYVRHARFERLGVFPFSPEPGTPAMRLDGHLPHDVAAARCDELMAVQQPMAFEFAESLVGYELDALIDGEAGVADDGTPLYTGRLYTDAPEIDATVTVAGACEVGSFAPVELVAADGYDWHGVVGGDEE